MGGFNTALQAVTSGIGTSGEEAGQGVNQALNEALKVRQQNFIEQNAAREMAYRYAQLGQTGKFEQQRNDLLHQQILANGWDAGVLTVDPKSGGYVRTYTNRQTGETRTLPTSGYSPDSPQAHLDTYKMLLDQGFDQTKAQEIAFKMGNLYRTDPAGMLQEYSNYAAQLHDDKGIPNVQIPGFGNVDISTPAGQARYAQIMADTNSRAASALYRALLGTGANKDMSGFTPGEMREYTALENTIKNQQGLRERLAIANINNTLDPKERQRLTQEVMDSQAQGDKQLSDKYNELYNARAWSTSAFMRANPNATPAQVARAKQQAKAAGKRVVD